MRHRTFLDGPDWFTGKPVEHEREALLRDLDHDLPGLTLDLDVGEDGSRGVVQIPDVVVDRLEVPYALPGPAVQHEYAGREGVVARPVAPVVVAGCSLRGTVDPAGFRIERDRCPGGGVARIGPRVVLPGVDPELPGLRDGLEGPDELACAHIKAADVAGRVRPRGRLETDVMRGAHHDHVACDGRRGAGPDRAHDVDAVASPVALHQVYDAVPAEVRDRDPAARVQRRHVVSGRNHQDTRVAFFVLPVADAPPGIRARGARESFAFDHAPRP